MPTILLLAFLATGSLLTWALTRAPRGSTWAPAPSSTQPAPPTGVVVIGDSLAVGLAPYFALWAKAQQLPFTQDAAVGRFTRQQGLEAVTPGSIVFVSLGTNDATSSVDGSVIRALAASLQARSPRAIFWLVPPATKALPGLTVVRTTITSLPGVLAVSTSTPVRGDGLHPSSYAAVFRDLEPILNQLR